MIVKEENPNLPTETHSSHNSGEFFLDRLITQGEIIPDMRPRASLIKALIMGVSVCLWLGGLIASPVFGDVSYETTYPELAKASSGVFYLILTTFMLVVPPIIKNWDYKRGILVGSLGSVFMVLAGALITSCNSDQTHFWCNNTWMYTLVVSFCVIFGMTASILWLSANRYINACTETSVKGRIFGIFVSSIFLSRVIRTIILAYGPQDNLGFYFLPIGLVILAIAAFCFSPEVRKYRDEGYTWTFKEEALNLIDFMKSEKVRPLLLFFFVVGMQGTYTEQEIVINETNGLLLGILPTSTAKIPIIQGFFAVIACLFTGFFTDKTNTKISLIIFNAISIFAMLISVLSYSLNNLALCYVTAVFMGIGSGGLLCLVFLIMAKDFKGTITCFTVAQFFYSFGTFAGVCLSYSVDSMGNPNLTPIIAVLFSLLVLNQIFIHFYNPK